MIIGSQNSQAGGILTNKNMSNQENAHHPLKATSANLNHQSIVSSTSNVLGSSNANVK